MVSCEAHLNKFIGYLGYLGIIDESSIQNANLNISDQKSKAEVHQTLAQVMFNFLIDQDKESIYSLCLRVVKNFLEDQKLINSFQSDTSTSKDNGFKIYKANMPKSTYSKEKYRSCNFGPSNESSLVHLKETSSYFFYPSHKTSNSNLVSKRFSERLDDYERLSSQRKEKIKKSCDDEESLVYTFTPELISRKPSSLNKSMNSSVYQRLYDYSSRDRANRLSRDQEKKMQIKRQSEITAPNHRKLDTKRIESLYYNYKQKQIRMNLLQAQIDAETGITFNPFQSKSKPRS